MPQRSFYQQGNSLLFLRLIRKEITSHKSSRTTPPSSPTSSSALKHGAFVPVQQALWIRHRGTLHADLVVYTQLTTPLLIPCSRRPRSQPSASSSQCSQHRTPPVKKTFPSQRYRVRYPVVSLFTGCDVSSSLLSLQLIHQPPCRLPTRLPGHLPALLLRYPSPTRSLDAPPPTDTRN